MTKARAFWPLLVAAVIGSSGCLSPRAAIIVNQQQVSQGEPVKITVNWKRADRVELSGTTTESGTPVRKSLALYEKSGPDLKQLSYDDLPYQTTVYEVVATRGKNKKEALPHPTATVTIAVIPPTGPGISDVVSSSTSKTDALLSLSRIRVNLYTAMAYGLVALSDSGIANAGLGSNTVAGFGEWMPPRSKDKPIAEPTLPNPPHPKLAALSFSPPLDISIKTSNGSFEPVPPPPLLSGRLIYFATGKDTLSAAAKQDLEQVVWWLTTESSGKLTLWVEGNCDHTGTICYNYCLSRRRAKATKEFLENSLSNANKRTNVEFELVGNGKSKARPVGRTLRWHYRNVQLGEKRVQQLSRPHGCKCQRK